MEGGWRRSRSLPYKQELLSLGGITQVLPPAYKSLTFFTAWKETDVYKTGGICQDPGSVPHLKKK